MTLECDAGRFVLARPAAPPSPAGTSQEPPMSAPSEPLPALTAEEAVSVHLALYHLLAFVPGDHLWSRDERKLWDAADGAMRRVRGMPPADEPN